MTTVGDTLWAGDAAALERDHIIDARYPLSGASAWLPHGYALCSAVLDRFRDTFAAAGYEELGLPSAVPLAAMERQAGSLKDFLDRIYLLCPTPSGPRHALASTMEAQISGVMARWLEYGRRPPFRVTTVRTVGRHERNGMRPLWKERFVWPFFEAQAATEGPAHEDIELMTTGPMLACDSMALPTIAVERMRDPDTPAAYADRRLELVTLLPDGSTTVLTSVYALGTRFSEMFGVEIGGRPLDMVNFAFSARLVLALLVHAHDGPHPVYHPSVAPVQVALVPERRESAAAALALAAGLRGSGVRARVFDNPKGMAVRTEEAGTHGAPLVCTVGGTALLNGRPLPGDGVRALVDALSVTGTRMAEDRRRRHDAGVTEAGSLGDALAAGAAGGIVRMPLCDAAPCSRQVLGTSLDVIGRPWRDTGTPAPCGCCGAPARVPVLLGTKFRGDK
ncbi:hypothetical protein [Actinacidiphila glaucinigra]|uniref:hypothetical protein n=1 Tax=Actinacidiphila glaucinigra TaxID=235986 RepID=UPI0036E921D1